MSDAPPLGTATLRTRLDLSGLRSGFSEAQSVTRSGVDGISSDLGKLGQVATRFGQVWTVAVTAPLTAMAAVGVRSAMQLETFAASLEVLIGDAERANRVFEELYEFSAQTPFDWRTLSDSTRVLAAFGVEAEDVVGTLGRLGDVAAGTQSDLTGLAEIYGRVLVTGRISMQEVNSLALRGVPIYTELAKVVGVTTEEIRELISSGTIGFPQLEQVISNLTTEGGRFFGMMEAQSLTTQGRLNTLKDTFEQVTDAIGYRFLPVFSDAIALAQRGVDWFNNLSEAQQGVVITAGTLAASIGPVALGFGGLLTVISKLPATLAAVRTGFVLLRASMLPFLGVAGIVVTLAAVVTSLALGLAGRGRDSVAPSAEEAAASLAELQVAAGQAHEALDGLKNATSTEGLLGSIQNLAGYLDGDARTSFINLANEAVAAGGKIEEVAEKITAAFVESQRSILRTRLTALQETQALLEQQLADAIPAFQRDQTNVANLTTNAPIIRDLERARAERDSILALPDWVQEQPAQAANLQRLNTNIALLERQLGTAEAQANASADAVRELGDALGYTLSEINRIQAALGGDGTVDAPGVDFNRPGSTTGTRTRVPRTVEDVLKELDAQGTAANRQAAWWGTSEAALGAAETRINLITRAINELLGDFYTEVTQEQLDGLRARLAAAENEAKVTRENIARANRRGPGSLEGRSASDRFLEQYANLANVPETPEEIDQRIQAGIADRYRRATTAVFNTLEGWAASDFFLSQYGGTTRVPSTPEEIDALIQAGIADRYRRATTRMFGTLEGRAASDRFLEPFANLATVPVTPPEIQERIDRDVLERYNRALTAIFAGSLAGRAGSDAFLTAAAARMEREQAARIAAQYGNLRGPTIEQQQAMWQRQQFTESLMTARWAPSPGPAGVGAGMVPGAISGRSQEMPPEIEAMINAGREARFNLAMASSEAARLQQDAAQSFYATVVQAGVQAGIGLVDAIRSGDVGSAISSLGQGAGSVLGALGQFGPAMGLVSSGAAGPLGLAAALVPMLAGFVGSLFNRRGTEEQAEAAERLRRQTPSIRLTLTNVLHYNQGFNLQDARTVGQIRRLFDGMMEDSLRRLGWENIRNAALGSPA